jgi:glycosyltransferase involved in cell wall biosynthesis
MNHMPFRPLPTRATISEKNRTVVIYRRLLLPYSETFIQEQFSSLRKWGGILAGRVRMNGLKIDEENVAWLVPQNRFFLSKIPKILSAATGFVYPGYMKKLKEKKPSLVAAHFGTNAMEASWLARKLGVPLVVTLHGYDINTHREHWVSGKNGFLMRSYPDQLLFLSRRKNVHFVAVSEAIAEKARKFGIPPEKIHVRHIGIDVDKFKPGTVPVGDRMPTVLFVGRLVEKKNCADLIRAVAQLRKDIPDVRLVVVGEGPQKEDLKDLADKTGCPVDFRGRLTPQEVAKEFDQARVFCLPSITAKSGDAEGFGMVVLEAQAAGVPVVTSALGGATEGLIQGETGFGFKEGDTGAMTEALRKCLTDDAFATDAGEKGRKFVVENFDIRDCTARLEDLYDEILEKSLKVNEV